MATGLKPSMKTSIGENEDEHQLNFGSPTARQVSVSVCRLSTSLDDLVDEETNSDVSQKQITWAVGNEPVQAQIYDDDASEPCKGLRGTDNQKELDPYSSSIFGITLSMYCSTRQENSGPEINELEMIGGHRDRVSEDNDIAANRIMKLRVFRKRFGEDLPPGMLTILNKRL